MARVCRLLLPASRLFCVHWRKNVGQAPLVVATLAQVTIPRQGQAYKLNSGGRITLTNGSRVCDRQSRSLRSIVEYRLTLNFGGGCGYGFLCGPCGKAAFLWQR